MRLVDAIAMAASSGATALTRIVDDIDTSSGHTSKSPPHKMRWLIHCDVGHTIACAVQYGLAQSFSVSFDTQLSHLLNGRQDFVSFK